MRSGFSRHPEQHLLHCADANVCMVVGATLTIRKTTNGGTTWTQQSSLGVTAKAFVKMYNKDTIVLGQTNGTFKRTLNGGGTWSADISGGTSHVLNDIAFLSNTNFTAIGASPTNHLTGGHITTSSTNTGLTWPSPQNVSGDPGLFGIHALSTTTFVACGGAASVYKTTDAGATWVSKLSGTPTTTTLYDINFPTASVGYAVGGNSSTPTTGGVVYKTTDEGETWVSASTGLVANALFGVHFVSADTGYVVGDGGFIQVTTNGGSNWTTQTSPVTSTLNKIYFPTNKIGYIAGAAGVILKTITGGFIDPLVVNAGSDASICRGGCVTLGSAPVATGGVKPYTYAWSTGSSSTSITVCPTSTTTYSLTVTDATSVVTTDEATVTVYTNPALSFTGLDATYCKLVSSDTLIATPIGGTFTGSGIATSDSVFNAFSAGFGTHTVTYTYTTSTGCPLSTSQTTTVLALPTPVPICLVTVDSAMLNTQTYVAWTKPVTTNIDSFRLYRKISSVMTPLVTLSYTANTTYNDNANGVSPSTMAHEYALSTFDTCGMESALSAIHSTIYLGAPAFSLPAKFDLSWTDYTGFTFTSYEIWRTVDGGTTWSKLNTVAFAAPNTYSDGPSPAPPLNSRYRIRATPSANCPTGGDIFKYSLSNVTGDFTGVSEVSLNNWLKVYPNPNHGTFSVELSGSGFEVSAVKVYNMLGEVVYHSAEKNKVSEVSIPGITPGVYHLEVITDMGTANKKITIQ